jgi:hypothetical protein
VTPRFITKVDLGYDRARISYSFPLDVLAPGSILTAFMKGDRRAKGILGA